MATVFRQPGSPYWYTAFFDGTGRRLRRSTKQRRRPDAVRVEAEMERLARRAAQPKQEQQSKEIYLILEEAGSQALRGKLNAPNAREFLNRIAEVATGEPIDNPSLEEWLCGWLEDKQGSRSKGTYARYKGVVDAFLKDLPAAKGKAPIAALTVADIRGFRNRLQEGGRTAATVNTMVRILRVPLTLARKQGYITHNPAEAIEPLTAKDEKKDAFTCKQVASLVEAAEGDWNGMILGGYYTGARINDLANLRWNSIDLERKVVAFVQGKTKRSVEIPLHPEFEQWLKQIPPAERNSFVFPSLSGRTSSSLSVPFRMIMEKARVEGELIEKQGTSGRDRSTLSFHSLRHSFNSEMANAGIPQEMRQRLTGHASKAVNDRYTHPELKTLRKAVESVPSL